MGPRVPESVFLTVPDESSEDELCQPPPLRAKHKRSVSQPEASSQAMSNEQRNGTYVEITTPSNKKLRDPLLSPLPRSEPLRGRRQSKRRVSDSPRSCKRKFSSEPERKNALFNPDKTPATPGTTSTLPIHIPSSPDSSDSSAPATPSDSIIDLTTPSTSPASSFNLPSTKSETAFIPEAPNSPCVAKVSRRRARNADAHPSESRSNAADDNSANISSSGSSPDSTRLGHEIIARKNVSVFEKSQNDHPLRNIDVKIKDLLLSKRETKMDAGYTYVFTREQSPDFCKIGHTRKTIEERLNTIRGSKGGKTNSLTGEFGTILYQPHRTHKKFIHSLFSETLTHEELQNHRYTSKYTPNPELASPRKNKKDEKEKKVEKGRTEWFYIDAQQANEVAAKWRDWLHDHHPYDEQGKLDEYWEKRFNNAELFDETKHNSLHDHWLELLNPPFYDPPPQDIKRAAAASSWMRVATAMMLLFMKSVYLGGPRGSLGFFMLYDLFIVFLLISRK
ncbi:hypothetical protein FQN50_009837 [Emmonsiellopsis sp. PD_5]|nr:hypothetical protein FQN50_009837 [Emmonsiellopsis sp. PD_5]